MISVRICLVDVLEWSYSLDQSFDNGCMLYENKSTGPYYKLINLSFQYIFNMSAGIHSIRYPSKFLYTHYA